MAVSSHLQSIHLLTYMASVHFLTYMASYMAISSTAAEYGGSGADCLGKWSVSCTYISGEA